jgi:uncharacterized membrane protein YphA (DoxX/SURF4 family)
MDVIALIGRILLALVFLGSGTTGHLGQRKGMAQYASSAGSRPPNRWSCCPA